MIVLSIPKICTMLIYLIGFVITFRKYLQNLESFNSKLRLVNVSVVTCFEKIIHQIIYYIYIQRWAALLRPSGTID